MMFVNNKVLRQWLKESKLHHLANLPGFHLNDAAFARAKVEVLQQHPEETSPDSRAAFRLLTLPKKVKPPKSVPQPSPASNWKEVLLWAWRLALLGGIIFLIALGGRAQGVPHFPITIEIRDEGSTLFIQPAGKLTLDYTGGGIACSGPLLGIITCTVAAGGGTTLDAVTAAAAGVTIASGDNAIVWNWALTTASKSAFTFGETTAATSTGTPILLNVQTLSASTAHPFQVTARGTANGIRVDAVSGVLSALGTGGIVATNLVASSSVVADAEVDDDITIDLADTATALAADPSDCGAGSFTAGINASGAAQGCVDLLSEAELDTEAELETQITDMANIIQAAEIDTSSEILAIVGDATGTGALVFGTSPTVATPLLTGKIDRNNVAVDDDDCTGEQGLYWYDTTDSAFEFCNANSGTPTVLGGGSGAPTDATYITQTSDAGLSAEQALDALASGIMRVDTAAGVITSLTDSAGIAANISDGTGTGALVFGTSPTFSDAFVADNTGLVIGHTAQINFGAISEFQVLGTGTPDSSMGFARFQDNSAGPDVRFLKSRGITVGAQGIVQINDKLGRFRFQGADGTDFNSPAAEISVEVDGTPGVNDMPGRILFSTTPDGSASVVERLRITSSGTFVFEAGATDPVLTPSSGVLNLSTGTLQQGGTPVVLESRTLTGGNGIETLGDLSANRTVVVDLNATVDGVGSTSNLSGMEFTATGELALLQGCALNEILKYNTTGDLWECSAEAGAAGGDSVTVNGSATTDVDLDDADPAAPAEAVNVQFQLNTATSPDSVSAHIQLLSSADGTGGVASDSGMETSGAGSDELALLQGCADGEILKWDNTATDWECAADGGGGGGSGQTLVTFDARSGIRPNWAFVAFTSGDTEPSLGDTIWGDTSDENGILEVLSLESGTWAGADAAGYMLLSQLLNSVGDWTSGENFTANSTTPGDDGTLTLLPVFAFATIDTRNSIPLLDFDDTANEIEIFFISAMPRSYAGGGVTVSIWVLTTSTTLDMSFKGFFKSVTDDVDNLDTKTFAAPQSNTAIDAPSASGEAKLFTITFTDGAQMDSIAVGEPFFFMLMRDAQDATNDDMSNDAEFLSGEIKET